MITSRKGRKISFFLPNVPNIFPCRLRFSISIHLAKTSARGIETRVGVFRVIRSRIRLSRIFTLCFSVCADMWYIILWSGQCEFHHTVPQRTKTRCRIMSHPKEDGCFKFWKMIISCCGARDFFFSPTSVIYFLVDCGSVFLRVRPFFSNDIEAGIGYRVFFRVMESRIIHFPPYILHC